MNSKYELFFLQLWPLQVLYGYSSLRENSHFPLQKYFFARFGAVVNSCSCVFFNLFDSRIVSCFTCFTSMYSFCQSCLDNSFLNQWSAGIFTLVGVVFTSPLLIFTQTIYFMYWYVFTSVIARSKEKTLSVQRWAIHVSSSAGELWRRLLWSSTAWRYWKWLLYGVTYLNVISAVWFVFGSWKFVCFLLH